MEQQVGEVREGAGRRRQQPVAAAAEIGPTDFLSVWSLPVGEAATGGVGRDDPAPGTEERWCPPPGATAALGSARLPGSALTRPRAAAGGLGGSRRGRGDGRRRTRRVAGGPPGSTGKLGAGGGGGPRPNPELGPARFRADPTGYSSSGGFRRRSAGGRGRRERGHLRWKEAGACLHRQWRPSHKPSV
ncbi:uncharacterized protein LOC109727502 [Ananas comosus]|uniref:Uncharacterized protein LOC109727502 n=1 Tax=Ananas comosus TaxID=4615 RepID=A0A6P5HAL7_ANACO|nr:uncharacterized protein LOC109727502 [Ananas comosus]